MEITALALTTVDYGTMVMLLILVAASLAMCVHQRFVVHAVIVYGAYSLIMALVWLQMNTPDIAITEAAAGIGMTVLMMVAIFRTSRRRSNSEVMGFANTLHCCAGYLHNPYRCS